MSILFKNTLILGLGLIGGSFAKALKNNNISDHIFAIDPNSTNIDEAIKDKLLDSPFDASTIIDFVVIACPLRYYKDCFEQISQFNLSHEALIIDLGSLKGCVLENIPDFLQDKFIGCHPIAGSHESGYQASQNNLFYDKNFIICTNDFTSEDNFNKLTLIIEKIGANKIILDEYEHDEIFCLTSHLPQFLSFMTKEFSPQNIEDPFFKKAFRLDNSNNDIWDDIFKLNANNLEDYYMDFFDELENNIENLANDKFNVSLEPNNNEFDIHFFEKNFAAIFFRFLIVKSYLEIFPKECKDFTGSGFEDFTSITAILGQKNISQLLKENKKHILKLFDMISL